MGHCPTRDAASASRGYTRAAAGESRPVPPHGVPSMSRDTLADAISFYDDLLKGDVLRQTHETLTWLTREQKATYGGRLLYRVMRPRFITPETHEDARQAALAVNRALE